VKQCKELNLKRHCKPLSVIHADNGFAAVNYVTFIISVRETKMESHKLAKVKFVTHLDVMHCISEKQGPHINVVVI
jgi:hypothetical protein